MAFNDRYGLPVSTSSAKAFDHYQDGMDRLLSYRVGAAESFAAAIEADDGLALAHAGAALYAYFLGDPSASASIGKARDRVAGTSRREQQHVDALSTLMSGNGTRGLAMIEEHVREFPRDALLVNQASSTIGFGGRADREEYRLAFVERLAPSYGDDWWYQSALSFAYHEVGRFEESRKLSEASLAQYPANANAIHNLAHVWFETLDVDAGAARVAQWLAGCERRSPYYCHLAWHLAMFELHRGRPERALEIHERDIANASNPRMTLMDGAAILWRLMLDGHAPLPWRPLTDVARRVARPGFVFGEIHAALAYAAAGDEAALSALIDGLRALDAKGHPIAGPVALPLVRGIAAYTAGDYATALDYFEPIDADIHRMGGSHAQWEIFEETMVVCQLELGRYDDAMRLLRRRLARRPSPRDAALLDRARAGGAAGAGAPAKRDGPDRGRA